jgi:hypothetical protein
VNFLTRRTALLSAAADSYRQRRTLAFDPKTEKIIPQAPRAPATKATGVM